MSSSTLEDHLDSLSTTEGVIGVVICDATGNPIRDTFPDVDRSVAVKYAQVAAQLARDAYPVGYLMSATAAAVASKEGTSPTSPDSEAPQEFGYGAKPPSEPVVSLRVRSRTVEFFIKIHPKYSIIVVQDPGMAA